MPVGLALGVLLLAAFFRLHRLDQVPVGLAPDLAFDGMDARDILAGHLGVFFPRDNGREALFEYVQTLILAGAGFRPLSFAYAGAAVGMLGVAAAYRLWKALFGARAALLGAALLAVSFWDVTSNRIGFRVNSLLPLVALSLYFLWRMLVSGSRRHAVCCGVAAGLALYTYPAARLLPVLIVVCLFATWKLTAKRAGQVMLASGVGLLVVAPEALYFVRHPEEFLLRPQAVATSAPAASLASTVGMLFTRGDVNATWNLIGQPVFRPWQSALFLGGLAIALWQARERPAWRWPVAWLVIMLLPAALSVDSPDSQRALAAAPAVFLFPAVALDALASLFARKGVAYATLSLTAAGVSASSSYLDYFQKWAANADVYGAVDAGRVHMAQFVQQRPESRVFFADSDITGHVVRMLDPRTEQDGWLPETSAAIPVPSHIEGDTLYVATVGAALKDLIPQCLPGVETWSRPLNPLNQPDFYAFTWTRQSADAFLSSLSPAGQRFTDDYELAGYRVTPAEGGVSISALWRPLQPSGPYDMYVHVIDGAGKVVAQSDRLAWPVKDFRTAEEGLGPVRRGYFDEGWETDDSLLTAHQLRLAPGSYVAEIGLTRRDPADPSKTTGTLGSIRIPIAA
ncbi:MAG TPA: glycosyltransferase family 39 protein [Chloroflexota bacterium]|nr:glycosyltransferase family 39 protein [Chloroflexota bacterium]